MRAARANRLARRAERRRPHGGRAWHVLTSAAHNGDGNAIAALWRVWLRDPRDDTWANLRRFVFPTTVFAAATDPARGAASRAAIGAFCVRHGMVPENAVKRVLFFVLTGQHEQYRAADPDGTLLATAYWGADVTTREALRHTMIGAGGLNLVRMIADRPDRVLTADEADHVARQLADAGEWDRLWRFIPTMRLPGAVRAARLFPNWRPDDDAGQAYLARLASTDPDSVTAPVEGRVTWLSGYHQALSFAPDNSELAVKHDRGSTVVHSLPGGGPRHTYPMNDDFELLALGGGVVVHSHLWSVPRVVVVCAPDRPAEVLGPEIPGAALARTPDGFVVGLAEGLRFGDATGRLSRLVRYHDLLPGSALVRLTAADPEHGHLALSAYYGEGRQETVLFDAERRPVARGPLLPRFEGGAFCGPDRLIVWYYDEHVETWRRDGGALVRVARTKFDGFRPVPLPAHGQVAVGRYDDWDWLDADTLTPVDRPFGLPRVTGAMAYSPDGSLAAVVTDRGTEVHDLGLHRIAALAALPLADLPPSALGVVAAQRNRALAPRVGEVVELLHAGLAHRFGAEVALGSGGWTVAGAHDIALGGE